MPNQSQGGRIAALDAVRGFAVLGILLMNIVSMGGPGYAYVDPTLYGLEGPVDWAVWAFNYVFSDGKMRALFTMLFGASTALIAERAASTPGGASPAETHYRRMFWLFVFGMIHAWLFWYGDILVQYALGGAIGFFLWRWSGRQLWIFAVVMLTAQFALELGHHFDLAAMRDAAQAPGANAETVAAWRETLATQQPDAKAIAAEVAGYRGGFADAFRTRAPMTIFFQTFLAPFSLPEILGYMAIGIAMLRNGFFTGQWSRARYLRIVALGYLVATPLMIPVARFIVAQDFDPVMVPVANAASFVLRPFIALAHAATIILLVQSGALSWLSDQLAAAGRMAFSNYLGTTLVTTTLFYGYGFGLFGAFSRAEIYIVVLGVWAVILLWSKPWLDRFAYGPLEWLWRSLARGQFQPMRRTAIAKQSH